ncbi:MAG: hypothetical protein MUC43_19820 [Pirellula sp.]|nr:hypothetical protein [Pirellula sp.]
MSNGLKAFVIGAVLVVFGVLGVFVCIDTMEFSKLGWALAFAILVSSVLYIPVFCFHYYETGSLRESFFKGLEFWIHSVSELFSSAS